MFTLAGFLHLKYTCGSVCVLLSKCTCVLEACAGWDSGGPERMHLQGWVLQGRESVLVAIGELVSAVSWARPLLSCAAHPGRAFLQWVHRLGWGGGTCPRGPLTSQASVPLPQAQPAGGTKYRNGRGNQKPSREMEHRCLRTTSKGPLPCQRPRVPAGPGCLFLQGPCPAPAPGWRGEQPCSPPNPSHYKLPFGGIGWLNAVTAGMGLRHQ